MRKFNVLARLFRRSENEVITQLYTHALNRPLFVEPSMGEALLGAYMAGAVDYSQSRSAQKMQRIAILEISGALASRPMPGPSGMGPQSYEEIRAEFDGVMDDQTIDGLVVRLDSPGGFAAGLFDLTDHIFSRRAEKPMVAVVDDIAFSAAYAIAASVGDIWVTRTGGVGSVGAVTYHVDQSEHDAQAGIKVTPIYAGARKIDFSPHFPLSDEAKRREQEIVDRLYEMFVDAVHRYRGLSAEAIEATEADIFHGQEALEVGFADRLGTLHDAVAALAAGDDEHSQEVTMSNDTQPAPQLTQPEPAPKADDQAKANAAMTAILESGLPSNLQICLLKAGLSEDQISARLEHAKAVHDLCVTAKAEAFTETFVSASTPVDQVRTMLQDKLASAADEQSVDVTLPGLTGGAAPPAVASAQDIYAQRRADTQKHISIAR